VAKYRYNIQHCFGSIEEVVYTSQYQNNTYYLYRRKIEKQTQDDVFGRSLIAKDCTKVYNNTPSSMAGACNSRPPTTDVVVVTLVGTYEVLQGSWHSVFGDSTMGRHQKNNVFHDHTIQ
jgi:hypothetical protein